MFLITKTVGNDREVIEKFDDLQEAMVAGEAFYSKTRISSAEDFVISVIEAESEDGLNKYKLYKSWS